MARKNRNIDNKFAYEKDRITGYYRIKALQDIGNGALFIKKDTIGGLIDDPNLLSQIGNCWIEYNAIVINSTIKDNAYIGGHAKVVNSIIKDNAQILENAYIYNSEIKDNAHIMGNSKIMNGCKIGGTVIAMDDAIITSYVTIDCRAIFKERAKIVGPIHIKHNITIDRNTEKEMALQLLLRYGKPNKNNEYTVYKLVRSTEDDFVYRSCYDDYFIYDFRKTRIMNLLNYSKKKKLCAEGLHVAFSEDFDWKDDITSKADKILTCLVNVNDFIMLDRVGSDKARVKKLKVTKVRNYPLPKELPYLSIYHKLNTIYLYPIVYNNQTNILYHNYHIYLRDHNSIKIALDIDIENDNINNYNTVIVSNLANEAKQEVAKPNIYMQNINFRYDVDLIIEHKLNSKFIIPIIYDLNNNKYQDITSNFKIELTNVNNITITPMFPFKKSDQYRLLLVNPVMPLTIGMMSSRGLANATPDSQVTVFMGLECDNDKSINIAHKYNTLDVFGCIIDYDLKEIINDCIFSRVDNNTVNIKFNDNFYNNHQYALFLSACNI